MTRADQVIVTDGRKPRMLHRSDCPHQEPGVTEFRDANTEELNTLRTCTDCASKPAT